ncbi:MAG: DUF3291 domain-containing protein [Lewinellaceae bacterium]|nr:DUF3291 domain-containing protein [Lewinellaceae bacterium]
MSQQVTTITFFRYKGLKNKFWAFLMMQFAHAALAKVSGLHFYKLMGSGRGLGFNPFPDWSVYSLLQVWDSPEQADLFFEESALVKQYRAHTEEQWTLYMKSISAGGSWSGGNPFQKSGTLDPDNSHIAVITRATIKISQLFHFWRYVPSSQKPLSASEGLLFTKGVGEVPIVQMATFSLWQDLESVKKFAYQSVEHQMAIKKTRDLNWYKEELFSRFQPYKSTGVWEGKNPLPGAWF